MARISSALNNMPLGQLPARIRRLFATPFFWLTISFCSTAIAANLQVGQDQSASGDSNVATGAPLPSAGQLRREGVRIEGEVARMIVSGDRMNAEFKQSGQSYRVLENLSLERIANAMKQDSHDYHWKVSGPLTEFQGQNFLLIEHAVRAPKGTAQ